MTAPFTCSTKRRWKAQGWRGSFSPVAKGSSDIIGRLRTEGGRKGPEPCPNAAVRLGARPIPTPDNPGALTMAVTRTFSIIKPDATRRNLTGAVTKLLEEAGLRVVASK